MDIRATNRSAETDGMEDPRRDWLQKIVRVRVRPEWGEARVLRWYPAAGGEPARLRIKASGARVPLVVSVTDVDIVDGQGPT